MSICREYAVKEAFLHRLSDRPVLGRRLSVCRSVCLPLPVSVDTLYHAGGIFESRPSTDEIVYIHVYCGRGRELADFQAVAVAWSLSISSVGTGLRRENVTESSPEFSPSGYGRR